MSHPPLFIFPFLEPINHFSLWGSNYQTEIKSMHVTLKVLRKKNQPCHLSLYNSDHNHFIISVNPNRHKEKHPTFLILKFKKKKLISELPPNNSNYSILISSWSAKTSFELASITNQIKFKHNSRSSIKIQTTLK